MMKCLLLTTSIYSDKCFDNLKRLLNSIGSSDDIDIEMHILIQNNPENLSIELPSFIKLHTIPNVVSLSKARNYMLERVLDKNFNYDIVMFPDDDCWFPNNNFRDILDYFFRSKCDFIITKYRLKCHDDLKTVRSYSPDVFTCLKNSSSITIFTSGKLFNKFLRFDERLGVGAEYSGGEDLDYALQSYFNSKQAVFLDGYLLAHNDKNEENKVKYYEGSLFVFVKNISISYVVWLLLIRKILVGVYYVISGKSNLKNMYFTFKKVLLRA